MRLTIPRLNAIIEALSERLAGEIETQIDPADYEAAREWAASERERRLAKKRKALLRQGH